MAFEDLLSDYLKAGPLTPAAASEEIFRLFGRPLPLLPPGEVAPGGGEKIFVMTHPELRGRFERYLAYISHRVSTETGAAPRGEVLLDTAEKEYERLLTETLRHVTVSDRRHGLVNLFWLAHSREICESTAAFFLEGSGDPGLRYRIHPILSGLFHRTEDAVFASFTRPQERMIRFQAGTARHSPLVRSIMHDQLPLTEGDFSDFEAGGPLLAGTARFPLKADAFVEIEKILMERLAGALRAEGKGTYALAAELCGSDALPGLLTDEPRLTRLLRLSPVRRRLLLDVEGTGSRLLNSRTLKKAARQAEGWDVLLSRYEDYIDCVCRAEVIAHLRHSLSFTAKGLDDEQMRQKFVEGRLYRLSPGAQIVSAVRTVTILFADIREFTRTSEGAISERDLTAELYRIFDPAAVVIRTFRGTIDKFLGDGFMATFGVLHRRGDEPLAAVRSAMAVMKLLDRLRELEKTSFQMGMSLHTGRASVARFLSGDERDEVTVIGRQVNIAGRLCSAKGAEVAEAPAGGEEEAGAPLKAEARSVGGVSIDEDSNLINAGIAATGNFLNALKKLVRLESFTETRQAGFRFTDPESRLRLNFIYVGEARFKGIEGAESIYSLIADRPSTTGEAAVRNV